MAKINKRPTQTMQRIMRDHRAAIRDLAALYFAQETAQQSIARQAKHSGARR